VLIPVGFTSSAVRTFVLISTTEVLTTELVKTTGTNTEVLTTGLVKTNGYYHNLSGSTRSFYQLCSQNLS
jgi:hypothetical protein